LKIAVRQMGELWVAEDTLTRSWFVFLDPNALRLIGRVYPVVPHPERRDVFIWWVAFWEVDSDVSSVVLERAAEESDEAFQAALVRSRRPPVAGWDHTLERAVKLLESPMPID
jgi:hypothetical protein